MLSIILIFFLILILLCLMWYLSYVIISCILPSKRAPTISSFNRDLNVMKKLKLKKWKKILDLWCASWKALRFFESEFGLIWEWYDINFFAIRWWKILNRIYKSKTKLFWKNFFKSEPSKYDYIYTYLLPVQMEYIENWVRENIWENTIIISNTFKFKKHQPFETFKTDKWKDRIYLYKKSI